MAATGQGRGQRQLFEENDICLTQLGRWSCSRGWLELMSATLARAVAIFCSRKKSAKNHWLSWHCPFKGSVERSLLPWAIFLIFTRNRPWKSEDHLCTLFFLKCQRKDSKKAKEHRQFRGVLGCWRTAAIDSTTFHACQRCGKTAVFAVFSSALGCHLASKSLSWPAMPVSNKKQEFEQRKRIKLFDDFWVRAYRFDFAPRRRPRARSM